MDDYFSKDETEIERARKILGKLAEEMSDEELQKQVAMTKYLVESWLDDFERSIFDGKTLNEFLNFA